MASVERPLRIAVIGAGRASDAERALAHELGTALARGGAVVVTGGLGGVMEAASRGAAEAGGVTVGILPGADAGAANPWVSLPMPTGLGEARNAVVVRSVDAVVAVGGEWGTLSEIALAAKIGVPVSTLGTPPASGLRLPSLDGPAEAAAWALEVAGRGRKSRL